MAVIGSDLAMEKIKLPVFIEEVVPHKAPMSLLRHVIRHTSELTVCDIPIERTTLFLEAGRVDAWIGLEYMAQAVAAHAGMSSRQSGKSPEIGFWLGTRRADFYTKGYRVGQTLHITARHVWGEGALFSFDCSITDAANGRCLAKAQLNVYRPPHLKRMLNEVKL
jgi:predicted hotdog family 3-hydroxylacyl-ACP dehydratase